MNIDDLYKNNFEEPEELLVPSGWDHLNRKLRRKIFLRFSPAKFNVYYLLLLISFSGFASYTGYRNVVLQKENKQIKQKEMHYKASIDSLKEVIEIISPDTAVFMEKPESLSIQRIRIFQPRRQPEIKETPAPIEHKQIKQIRKTIIIKPTVLEQTDTVKIFN